MEKLTQIPKEFVAGDSVEWTVPAGDFPAPEYSMSYVLVAPSSKQTITSTPDGENHHFSLTPTITAAYIAGRYDYQTLIHGDAFRKTSGSGVVTVLADYSAQANFDGRDWLDRAIETLEASIENRASKTQLSQKFFNGVEIGFMSQLDQMALLDKLYAKRIARNSKRRIKAGKSVGRIIGVKF